jgi:hypothetical protein
VSHVTLDPHSLHLLSSMRNETINKTKPVLIELNPIPTVNTEGKNLTDRFEQARMAFFSKQVFRPESRTDD